MKRGGQGERRRNGSLAAKSLVNFAVRHGGYGGFSMDTAGETKGEEARGRRPICVGSRACTLLPIGGCAKKGPSHQRERELLRGIRGGGGSHRSVYRGKSAFMEGISGEGPVRGQGDNGGEGRGFRRRRWSPLITGPQIN